MSRKRTRKAAIACQNDVRTRADGMPVFADVARNLGHLVTHLGSGGKVAAYQEIATRLSELAGRSDRAWTWRYVASVHSGTIQPSHKFLRVLALLLEEHSPRAKQWFYFARYHSLAAVYDKTIKREMIIDHMKRLGYREVCWTRYMQLKSSAVRKRKSKQRARH